MDSLTPKRDIDIYSLNVMCLENIVSFLTSTRSKNEFFIALISGSKKKNSIYRALLSHNVSKLVDRMNFIGTSVGWTYRSKFNKYTKAKRIANKWKNPQYCQACGSKASNSQDTRFDSTKDGLRVCMDCLFDVWESMQCHCGNKVAFCDEPDLICNTRLMYSIYTYLQTGRPVAKSTGRITYRIAYIPQKWYAICEKRLMRMLHSTLYEIGEFKTDSNLTGQAYRNRFGCNFKKSITEKCHLYVPPHKVAKKKSSARGAPVRRSKRIASIKAEKERKKKQRKYDTDQT